MEDSYAISHDKERVKEDFSTSLMQEFRTSIPQLEIQIYILKHGSSCLKQ